MKEQQAVAASEQPSLKTSANVMALESEEGGVLINLATDQHYGLDPVGLRIWQLLAEFGDIDQVIAPMLAEYDVTETILRRDVAHLVKHWRKIGLLEKTPGQNRVGQATPVSSLTQADGKNMLAALAQRLGKLWRKWRYSL